MPRPSSTCSPEAGGLSEGFSRAGFKTLAAVEKDEMAARTYRLNHPGVPDERVIEQDIRDIPRDTLRRLAGKKPLDVLAGSPPCQGFSSVGFRSKKIAPRIPARGGRSQSALRDDGRGCPRPQAEAVPPGKRARDEVGEARRRIPSSTTAAKLLADPWRLPDRHLAPQRLLPSACRRTASGYFLVASRLKVMPVQPTADYQDTRRPEHDHDALPPLTLTEAIFDLPERGAGEGVSVDGREPPDPSGDRQVPPIPDEVRDLPPFADALPAHRALPQPA